MMMQAGAMAKIVLPEILSDNMVLQQQTDVCLWGKADSDKEITICPSWTNNVYRTMSDKDGKWIIKIETPSASYQTYAITLSDGEETKLSNILIGEVWFCSGQYGNAFKGFLECSNRRCK